MSAHARSALADLMEADHAEEIGDHARATRHRAEARAALERAVGGSLVRPTTIEGVAPPALGSAPMPTRSATPDGRYRAAVAYTERLAEPRSRGRA